MVSRLNGVATEVHLLGWNPHVGGDSDERIEDIVKENKGWADFFAFNEVRPIRKALAVLAKILGLLHIQEFAKPYGAVVTEDGSSALLVNKAQVDHKSSKVIVLSRIWEVFSANRKHKGRRLVSEISKKDGVRIRTVVVHGPTNGPTGGNRFAYAEFFAVLLRIILSTRPRTVVIIVGDWNAKRDDIVKWLDSRAVRTLGLTFDGHNVDWCLCRGGRVVARVGKSKRGSDHYPVWFTIYVLERKIAKVRKALAGRK